ncbi:MULTISPECIES: ABC transporter ATP-binding protein [unclassified Pseudodesulfovibrio]|uniref:ABC transporter ATP-binding protein n=1 Tax=unclassified Pseudodesulfovibrio TaxID=2661612 RepID=UPI000FEC1DC9|nr:MULTISPECIES: ABC transporter ATP-binding protein [unclassified Pseudodesulfovibrio]MCJ2162944.1 ABC transporter ATP-binding protein [Pseudodesulfovibrio sp. S3-i]RWU06944.1 ABC transporter ATP-binding protein [Pseudodesulfovibrio sp. S3]
MDGTGKTLLSVRRAAKFFGNKLVFKEVSCEILPGQILLVAGPNGAGKSTLMRIMAGLSRPSAGEVALHLDPADVAYLGHATFIYPGLSALENLKFWASMYGLSPSREEFMALLKRVGLERAAEEKAGSFSRGMAQRLNLARIYQAEPKLLFLDEPGTGLDPRSLARLRGEITGFRDKGISVVWISHHVVEDTALADTVLALGGKKVEYFGPAADFVPEAVC